MLFSLFCSCHIGYCVPSVMDIIFLFVQELNMYSH